MDAKWDAMEKKYDSQRYVPKDPAALGRALGITITNLDDSETNNPTDAIDFLEAMKETRIPKSQTKSGGRPAVVKVYNPATDDFTIRGGRDTAQSGDAAANGGATVDDGAAEPGVTGPKATVAAAAVEQFSEWAKIKWIVKKLFKRRA